MPPIRKNETEEQTVREKNAAKYENERLKRLDEQLIRQRSLRSNKSRDENLARLESIRENIAQGSNATSDQRITRMQTLRGNMAQARLDEETVLRFPRLKYVHFS